MKCLGALICWVFSLGLFAQSSQICLTSYQPLPVSGGFIGARSDSSIVSVNCVFHILYAQNADNLSEAQIHSQIVAINRDFSGNPQINCAGVNYFNHLIASPNIRFCLATIDPAGNPTSGITRTQTFAKFGSTNVKNAAVAAKGGKDAWPSDRYLNIWVVPFEDNVLGYSGGLALGESHDGIFLNSRVVGTIGALEPNYDLGHTLSHEIGHYFGLNHIWGGEPCTCTDDDGIADTPPQDCYNYTCNYSAKSCGELAMHSNLMDYSYDACRGYFTKGQVRQLRSVLKEFRKALTESAACAEEPLPDFPTLICNDFVLGRSGDVSFEYQIYDFSGKLLWSGVANGDYLRVDMSSAPAGIYLLSKISGEQQSIEKIVICR